MKTNTRLIPGNENTESSQERLKQLYEKSLIITGEPRETMDRLGRLLLDIFNIDTVIFSEIHGNTMYFRFVYFSDGDVIENAGENPLREGPDGVLLDAHEISFYGDILEKHPGLSALCEQEHSFFCGYPALGPSGKTVVIISILGPHAVDSFDENDRNLLTVISRRAAFELEREKKLLEAPYSLENYNTVIQKIQEIRFITDVSGVILEVSPSVKKLLDYEPKELLNQNFYSLFVDQNSMERLLNFLYLKSGVLQDFETQLKKKDGTPVWISFNAEAIYDSQGEFAGIKGLARDINESKKARDLQTRLGRILDNSFNEIFIFNARNLKFLQVNQGALNNLGYTLEEIRELTPADIKPDYTLEEFKILLEPLKIGRVNVINFETRHKRKDGTTYDVEINLQLSYEESPPVFVAIINDISRKKHADEEMRKLYSVIKQIGDGVIVTDRDGIVEYVNEAYVKMTGYAKEEVMGVKVGLTRSGKHDQEFYQNLWDTILSGEVFREVFINRRKNGEIFYEDKTITPLKDEQGNITHFASTGNDITERIQTQKNLQYLAHHDILTGLPNRALFWDRLHHALDRSREPQTSVAVIFLDLDHFKFINDSLGHDIGDEALRLLSKRLTDSLRKGDTVARIGGDEFAIILEDLKAESNAENVAKSILTSLSKPIIIGEHEFFLTASIGISLFPEDGSDPSALLKNADIAMYRAKDKGRNTYQFFSADMSIKAFKRLNLETSLRHALERNEFLFHYQPIIDLQTGEMRGLEALLRWEHPTLGLVSPNEFIPLLEETGLINQIGEWSFLQAFEESRLFRLPGKKPPRISINLSSRQFYGKGIRELIYGALEKTGYEPSALGIEITESLLFHQTPEMMELLNDLKGIGIRLSIDDFGTGYSSLSYLKKFPIDVLKIDRSFISDLENDPEDRAIINTVIAMAKNLNMRVIAEGVETAEQSRYLSEQGCEMVQGYYYCRPLAALDLHKIIKENQGNWL